MSSDVHISSQALTEIESRHQDIISLESSISELHEIFADMAILLEIQVKKIIIWNSFMNKHVVNS